MDLFPLGEIEINADDSTGEIDGITYYFFGPNLSSRSVRTYNNLVTLFQTQTKQTRKKAEPYLSITYEYDNIWEREFRQIEHFVDYKEDALESFYAVNLARGIKPSNIIDSDGWVISITNTRLYSTIANNKAHYAFVWDGSTKWRLGEISSISGGSSITMSLDYGDLTLANAQYSGYVYPVYSVYFNPNALADFTTGVFVKEDITNSTDGGFVYSGMLTFNSKYSV